MKDGGLATESNAQISSSSDILHSSFPLSYAQTGVYFDCLKNPASTLYNIPLCIKFRKDTDTTTLAGAVRTLVKAHPQMTVHFGNGEEGIVQTVDLEKVVEIPVKQMSEEELAKYKQDFVKPFDLGTGPLYRFEIATTEKQTCLLMDVHHLVFDGGSSDIFLQQLCSLMNGETIEDEDQNYAAYVMAEKAAEGGEDYRAAANFFKEQLSVVESVTEVRPDLPNPVKVTVERMIANPAAVLTSICIVSDKEAERIIKLGTGKEIDVDLSKTFANLFTEQAKRTPDAPAVVDRDGQLTYGEMDRYSNALAHQLIEFGVQPNDFVCVMLDRFKEFPLAVLSIHKAGAAYTPPDFEYPNERLSYMLENSESKVLITSHDVLEAKQAEGDFSTAAAKTFFIDDFMADVPDAEPIDLSNPDGLAYMIYTSGLCRPKSARILTTYASS